MVGYTYRVGGRNGPGGLNLDVEDDNDDDGFN
jgi:hypothetical protein